MLACDNGMVHWVLNLCHFSRVKLDGEEKKKKRKMPEIRGQLLGIVLIQNYYSRKSIMYYEDLETSRNFFYTTFFFQSHLLYVI